MTLIAGSPGSERVEGCGEPAGSRRSQEEGGQRGKHGFGSPFPWRTRAVGERRSSRHLGRLEELEYRPRVLASCSRMLDERNPVRALRVVHLGKVREHTADYVEVPEHRGREEIEAGAVLEQQERDLAPAHVRGGAERGLPVPAAPVPGGVDERRLLLESLANVLEVAVRARDERLDRVRIERCWFLLHVCAHSAAAFPARRPKTVHSRSEFPIIRFRPCVPPAISPQAKTPSSVVSARSSMTRPPF